MASAASTDERQQLLIPRPNDDDDSQDECRQLPQDSFAKSDHVSLFVMLAFAVITKTIGSSLYAAAVYSVEYNINCGHYLPNSTASSPMQCRSDDANAEFFTIETWKNHLGMLVGLLTAVPYGLAADRFSRRNLLALSIGGILISMAGEIIVCLFPNVFPLRLVWLAVLFTLIGGGPLIFSALVFAIASDVSSDARRVIVFFLIEALTIMAAFLSQPLYKAMANRNPWLAVYMGLAMTCISTIFVLFLPATRDVASLTGLDSQNESVPRNADPVCVFTKLYRQGRNAAKRMVSVGRLVTRENKRLGLLLLGAFLFYMSHYSPVLTVFYLIRRLNWTLSDANLVSVVKSWTKMAVVAVVLPTTSLILNRLRYNPAAKDLWLARGIILAVVAGLVFMGFSNGRAMIIMGTVLLSPDSAFIPVARSLLVLFNGGQHTGLLFTLIAAMQSLSLLVGLPFLLWLFKVGSYWGSVWYGLPFFVLAILTALAGGSVANFRGRHAEAEGEREEPGGV
ncbi:hypothetical protein E4U34_000111 [Claviceps purpurea]|nr:hypothetical protein E4U34_000111 [Claviceps purpurea]KAG6292909.1 hypothetical protein E4U45_006807 [Claviceps purpurea]